ncbi:MAG: hypothetical protein WKF77_31085 [Planctomycetaceae bacterium]
MGESHTAAEQYLTERTRKRRRIIGLFAVPLILLVAVAAYALFGTSQLDREIAALRSQGLPTNTSELNAYYSVPPDVTDTTEFWTAATTAVSAAGIDKRAAAIPIVGMGPTPIPEPGNTWAELEVSRTFLQELDSEMQLIRRAAVAGGMSRYAVDFRAGINTLLPDTQETRTLARLLTLSVHVHAHDSKCSEVLHDLTAILAVSDSLRGEPILISHLVRMATHAMACQLTVGMLRFCQWTDDELASLQSAVGHAKFRPEMLRAIHGERALCLSTMDTTLGPLYRNTNKLRALEMYRQVVDGLETSWPDAAKPCEQIDGQLKSNSRNIFSSLQFMSAMQLLPSLRQTVVAGTRAEARQNCLIAAIAACRYRLEHAELPKSLADLKGLIPGDESEKNQRLTDPFDGQPLRFRSGDSCVIIYSVSDNMTDDGGVIDGENPREGDLGYSIEK